MMGCFSCYGEPKAKDLVKGHLHGKAVAPLKQSNTDETDEGRFQGAKIVSSRDRGNRHDNVYEDIPLKPPPLQQALQPPAPPFVVAPQPPSPILQVPVDFLNVGAESTPALTEESEFSLPPLPPIAVGEKQAIPAQTFSFGELERSTRGFSQHNFVGEGGFGRVYKGVLESTGQLVAVKQLDRNGLQGNREFLVEVLMLSLLHHPNLVNLIGYCADGDQRLLVYEFMAQGCLEDHLHDFPDHKEPLDWNIRMKVAAGAAKGLEYLHDKANPPVIYRDFKSSNILLDESWHPKLSDFGLAKLGPVGDKTHVSTRVMGTYGYCAPEYAMTGQLTLKSDVYSFGVVLLELITGRKAIDNQRGQGEHNLVAWARPLFKDRRKFPSMADPCLRGRYPMRGLYQALAVAAMCLQEQASTRPGIGDVVTALSYLAAQKYDPNQMQPARYLVGAPGDKDRKERERRGSRSPRRVLKGSPNRASPRDSPDGRGGKWDNASDRGGEAGSPTQARGYRENANRQVGRMASASQKTAKGDIRKRGDSWKEDTRL